MIIDNIVDLNDIISNIEGIYLYGARDVAEQIITYIVNKTPCNILGVLVSSKFGNPETLCGFKVMEITEINMHDKALVLVCANKMYWSSIGDVLKEHTERIFHFVSDKLFKSVSLTNIGLNITDTLIDNIEHLSIDNSSRLQLGTSSVIDKGTYIVLKNGATLKVGNNVKLGLNMNIHLNGGTLEIGDNSSFAKDCIVYGGANTETYIGEYFSTGDRLNIRNHDTKVIIGPDCMFSYDIVISAGDGHGLIKASTGEEYMHKKNIIIGKHVWLGIRSTILGNTRIGDGSIVGASSTVFNIDVPENCSVGGYPAKILNDDITWKR